MLTRIKPKITKIITMRRDEGTAARAKKKKKNNGWKWKELIFLAFFFCFLFFRIILKKTSCGSEGRRVEKDKLKPKMYLRRRPRRKTQ